MTFNMGPAFWQIRGGASEAYCPVDSFNFINWDATTPSAFTVTGSNIFDLGSFEEYFVVDGDNAQLWDGTSAFWVTITVVDPSVTKFDSVRLWTYSGDLEVYLYDEDLVTRYYLYDYVETTDPVNLGDECPDADFDWHGSNSIEIYLGRVFRTKAHPPLEETGSPTNMKNIKKIEFRIPGGPTSTGEGAIDRVEFFCSNPEVGAGEMPWRYIYKTDGTAGVAAGTRVIREGTTVTAFTGF
jgi:hypothetical protein